ncbi:hypothetical protein ABPG74_012306 [Tetrahymena malaccensis]
MDKQIISKQLTMIINNPLINNRWNWRVHTHTNSFHPLKKLFCIKFILFYFPFVDISNLFVFAEQSQILVLSLLPMLSKFQKLYQRVSDGIASGVVVYQIYDLYGNIENQQNLNLTLDTYDNMLYKQIINQQYAKNFYYNVLIILEGKHVAFIINQSKIIATVAQIISD